MGTTRRRRKSRNPNQAFDVAGIVLLFMGPVLFVCLTVSHGSGAVGAPVREALLSAFGDGAFVFPILCIVVGGFFILGPITVWSRNAGIGALLIFISVIAWKGITGVKTGTAVETNGGIIGAFIAQGLLSTAGEIIGKILLALIFVLGSYIAVDLPVVRVLGLIRDACAASAEAARGRISAASNGRNGRDKNGVKAKVLDRESETQDKPKRKLLPIFVRKDKREERETSEPEERKIPVTTGHTIKVQSAGTDESLESPGVPEGEYRLPPLSLLNESQPPPLRAEDELKESVQILERTLEEFGMDGDVVEIAHGPTVTRYEIRLAPGIKVSKIVSLADNLAMSLEAISAVRVEAPIPGKSAIGVEVPNKNRALVGLREVLDTDEFRSQDSKLLFALGKDVSGEPKYADLTKMPHLLIGGTTNSGKSVCLASLIMSLLYRATPEELKMVLIDPKRVELSLFDGIPHLACPVVRDAKQAAGILRAVAREMDNRYELLFRAGSRNIQEYNKNLPDGEKLPYLVIICDELAELMMKTAAEVEESISRLAQLARAVGIHLVLATQRPSVNVVTGLIKANISSRIAFAVSAQVDSRTILDLNGAEKLIGQGDMLFLPMDRQKPIRVQGCYVSEKEVHNVVEFLKSQRKPMYTIDAYDIATAAGEDDGGCQDELYEQAVRMVVANGSASTSMIQRKFRIGYTRAARLVDAMEAQGIVGPLDGAKPREVLISRSDLDRLFGGRSGMKYEDEEEEYPDGGNEEE